MVSSSDISRCRCSAGIRPAAMPAATRSSITTPPRCRSSSPSRTCSGSHPPARTAPSRPATAGATVTGWANTSISPEVTGTAETTSARGPAVLPGQDTSAARTAIIPAGNPAMTCATPLPGSPPAPRASVAPPPAASGPAGMALSGEIVYNKTTAPAGRWTKTTALLQEPSHVHTHQHAQNVPSATHDPALTPPHVIGPGHTLSRLKSVVLGLRPAERHRLPSPDNPSININ